MAKQGDLGIHGVLARQGVAEALGEWLRDTVLEAEAENRGERRCDNAQEKNSLLVARLVTRTDIALDRVDHLDARMVSANPEDLLDLVPLVVDCLPGVTSHVDHEINLLLKCVDPYWVIGVVRVGGVTERRRVYLHARFELRLIPKVFKVLFELKYRVHGEMAPNG